MDELRIKPKTVVLPSTKKDIPLQNTDIPIRLAGLNTKQICEALLVKSGQSSMLHSIAHPSATELVMKAPLSWQKDKKGIAIDIFRSNPAFSKLGFEKLLNKSGLPYKTAEGIMSSIPKKELSGVNADIQVAAVKANTYAHASGSDITVVPALLEKMYPTLTISSDPVIHNIKDSWNVRAIGTSTKPAHALFGERMYSSSAKTKTDIYKVREDNEAVDYGKIQIASKYLSVVLRSVPSNEFRGQLFCAVPMHSWPIIEKESFFISDKLLTIDIPVPKRNLRRIENAQSRIDSIALRKTQNLVIAYKYTDTLGSEIALATNQMLSARINSRLRPTVKLGIEFATTSDTVFSPPSPDVIIERYATNFSKDYLTAMSNVIYRRATKDNKFRESIVKIMLNQRIASGESTGDELLAFVKTMFTVSNLRRTIETLTSLGYNQVTSAVMHRWSALLGSHFTPDKENLPAVFVKKAFSASSSMSSFSISVISHAKSNAYRFDIGKNYEDPMKNSQSKIAVVKHNYDRIKLYWEINYQNKIASLTAEIDKIKEEKKRYFRTDKGELITVNHTSWGEAKSVWVKKKSEINPAQVHMSALIPLQVFLSTIRQLTWIDLLTYPPLGVPVHKFSSSPFFKTISNFYKKRKLGTPPTITQLTIYDYLFQLDHDIDRRLTKPHTVLFTKIFENVSSKLNMLARDVHRILDGQGLVLEGSAYDLDFDEGPFKLLRQAAAFTRMEENTIKSENSSSNSSSATPLPSTVPINAGISFMMSTVELVNEDAELIYLMSTWGSDSVANKVAEHAGFKDFHDMYKTDTTNFLLEFDPENPLCISAKMKARSSVPAEELGDEEEDFIM